MRYFLLKVFPLIFSLSIWSPVVLSQWCGSSLSLPATVNGVQVNGSFTSGTGLIYPNWFTSCSYTTYPNSPLIGASNFVYELNFSAPVNDIEFVLTATGESIDEEFTFNTNSSLPPTIIDVSSCFSTVVGNTIYSGSGSTYPGGGGVFRVYSNSGPFTSLQISGPGGSAGSLFSICEYSIVPQYTDIMGANISCNGVCDGTAEIIIGNNSTYNFDWNTGDTTALIDSLCAGLYTCVVTDSIGGIDSLQVVINEPPLITVVSDTLISSNCFGTNEATYEVTASGGTGQLSYELDSLSSQSGIFSNLEAGIHYFTITDENSCTISDSISINEPPQLILTLIDSSSTTCNSNSDGFIEVQAQGGTGSHNFFLDGQSFASGLFTNLTSGSYDIIVVDSNGCQDSLNIILQEKFYANLSVAITNETCYGTCNGEIALSIPSSNEFEFSIDNCSTSSTDSVFSNLCPNDYVICVSDTSNCFLTDTISVLAASSNDQPDLYPIGELCLNNDPVSIEAANIGLLSGSTGIVGNTFDPQQAGVGVHQIINTTNLICGTADTISIVVNPFPTPSFQINDSVMCVGDTLNLVYTGSIVDVFSWNVDDALQSNQPNPTLILTYPGQYDISLTVEDSNGCVNNIDSVGMVYVQEQVIANFSYTIDEQNNLVHFNNLSSGAALYHWLLNGLSSSQVHPTYMYQVLDTVIYIELLATNTACEDSTFEFIQLPHSILVYVPNAFTPDGNSLNAFFSPVVSGIDNFDFSFDVYNRWGELVFSSLSPLEAWDGTYEGKPVPEGVYTWVLHINEKGNAAEIVKSGHVNLIR